MAVVYSLAPWTTALEVLHGAVRESFEEHPDSPIDAKLCNLVSMVERTIAWGLTGSARVLSRTLMDRFCITLGIFKAFGYPSLSNVVKLNAAGTWSIDDPLGWPTNADGDPLSCVDSSILFTYGQDLLDVSAAYSSRRPRVLLLICLRSISRLVRESLTPPRPSRCRPIRCRRWTTTSSRRSSA